MIDIKIASLAKFPVSGYSRYNIYKLKRLENGELAWSFFQHQPICCKEKLEEEGIRIVEEDFKNRHRIGIGLRAFKSDDL